MIRLSLFRCFAVLVAATPASAAQSLIPTPYPSGVTGALPLDPEPQGRGGPQRLNRDPYPQILGENAQGNPPISRRQRHQHLIPSSSQRKYRVDRLPTYPQ
jgi:hypothetical protein